MISLIIFLLRFLLCGLTFFSTPLLLPQKTITDSSNTIAYQIDRIITPNNIQELQNAIRTAKKPISVAGGRYSQGGHIAAINGTVIDTRKLNKIINFSIEQKLITVQAGATWHEIQKFIDPHNLSVNVMQSYNDFTIGGSLAVNVHGRQLSNGQIIETVKSIVIMLADGTLIEANREQNTELFSAVIGGYGRLGIIIQATLQLTDNEKLERKSIIMSPTEYVDYFFRNIKNDPNAVLHNANIYPDDFKIVQSITWYKTNNSLTINERLQKTHLFYPLQALKEILVRRIYPLKKVRPHLAIKELAQPMTVWRNYEMSYSVNSLAPLKFPTTSILQEYFIPVDKFNQFIAALRKIVKKHSINVLNASIRYVPANNESILTYAPQDSFAVVLYINKLNLDLLQKHNKKWTKKLIDKALKLGGTYYLPYELFATQQQFSRAYPQAYHYKQLQEKYDPGKVFNNTFWQKYNI